MTLDEFKALEGQDVGVSSWMRISQAQIDAFAEATHDHQFIHVDPEKAAKTPFGSTIAHGFLTLSLLSAMSYEAVPTVDGTAMGVNYGMNRMRFVSPVKVNSRVRGRFKLKSVDMSKPGEFTSITEVTVEIEGQDKPALIAEWIGRRYLETT
ncbi:MAG: MaoC family dehydratase [Maritimibacter sp.]